MNIFYFDSDLVVAAQYMCNKHVVKMPTETAQLLCSAHHILDGPKDGLYRLTHKNHPSSVWVRSSSGNYKWAYAHFVALCEEYTYRYGKVHASETKLKTLLKSLPSNIIEGDFYEPPLVMPDYCKCDNAIDSYRKCYIMEKKSFAKWSIRSEPEWWSCMM